MSEGIPHGWAEVTVSVLANDIGYGFTAKSSASTVGPKYLRITDIQNGSVNWASVPCCAMPANKKGAYALLPGDLVFARTGATTGKSYLITSCPDAVFASYLIRVRPSPAVLPEFLSFFFQSRAYWDQISENLSGSAQPNCNASKLSALIAGLPPMNEQRRIVANLEALLGKIKTSRERLAKIPRILKRFRQAVLTAACSGKLSAAYRGAPIEDGWEETQLGEILTAIEAGRSFSCDERPPKNNEIGVLKISAVTWGVFDENESKTCSDPSLVNKEYFVRAGDLLMTRANTIELVGAVALAERVSKKLMLSDKTLRLRVSKAALPRWVLYWLRSTIGREQIESLATGNQQSMHNISQGSIRSIQIRIPPLEEQQWIEGQVERLMGFADRLEGRYEKAKAQIDTLTQSIVAKAFRGELVPTEAALAKKEGREYESAEQLLARI